MPWWFWAWVCLVLPSVIVLLVLCLPLIRPNDRVPATLQRYRYVYLYGLQEIVEGPLQLSRPEPRHRRPKTRFRRLKRLLRRFRGLRRGLDN